MPYKKGVVTTPREQNYPGMIPKGKTAHGWGPGGGGMKKMGNYGGGSMKGRRHNSMTGGYR